MWRMLESNVFCGRRTSLRTGNGNVEVDNMVHHLEQETPKKMTLLSKDKDY